jgi:hypothetical protein
MDVDDSMCSILRHYLLQLSLVIYRACIPNRHASSIVAAAAVPDCLQQCAIVACLQLLQVAQAFGCLARCCRNTYMLVMGGNGPALPEKLRAKDGEAARLVSAQ